MRSRESQSSLDSSLGLSASSLKTIEGPLIDLIVAPRLPADGEVDAVTWRVLISRIGTVGLGDLKNPAAAVMQR